MGIGIDITARKETEAALSQSEERFKEMAELLHESVFEADTVGNLTYVNSISLERFGYSREDLEIGVNILDVFAPP